MTALRNRSKGFTLVEALVAIVVSTIMILLISNYMLNQTENGTLEASQANVLRETEASLDLVNQDIRLSANADQNNRYADPNSPGGAGNQYGWTSNGSTLILATAAQDNSGNIIFSDPQTYVTTKNNLIYYVSGGTLYKRTLAAPASGNSATTSCPPAQATASCPADKELLHNITSFSITYLDGSDNSVTPTSARSVELNVTVSVTQYGHVMTAKDTTRMVFRND